LLSYFVSNIFVSKNAAKEGGNGEQMVTSEKIDSKKGNKNISNIYPKCKWNLPIPLLLYHKQKN
jgi:hypothetical protein